MSSVKYKDYEKFGNLLVEDVLKRLTGSHEDYERFLYDRSLSTKFLIGNLEGIPEKDIPKKDKIKVTDDSKKEDLEEKDENDFEIKNDVFETSLNSMSIKFLLEEPPEDIPINLKLSLFYRVIPSYEEQLNEFKKYGRSSLRIAPVWKRHDATFDLHLNKTDNTINLDFSKDIDTIKHDKNLLKQDFKVYQMDLSDENSFNNLLASHDELEYTFSWKGNVILTTRDFNQKNKNYTLVEIKLINNTPIIEEERFLFEASFFNPKLKILLEKDPIKFNYKYTYEGKYKESFADFRCINCHAEYDPSEKVISSKNYAITDREKKSPRNNLPNVDISFNKLSHSEGLDELEKIYENMNDHISNSSSQAENYESFKKMRDRFKKGINELKNNDNASYAFNLMNKTFLEMNERLKELTEGKKGFDGWRLFQIVFIVSLIPDIVYDTERDTCELLHVMTGGGKSETYFGAVIFTAFFDRIRGKKFGVSAVTKFPLRMLSIQQLQRIANVFIFAEEVRLSENIDGEPFSIAYFVGSRDEEFPGNDFKLINEIKKLKEKNKSKPGKIIDKCPICGHEVNLDIDEKQNLVIHKCTHCTDKIFRLYFTDDEIYRTLPTFIVSTVDKWAGIAQNRRFRNLLGGKLDYCNLHGFLPRGDGCSFYITEKQTCGENDRQVNINFDTSPTLIIQDEMHLIGEGFGTIESHFESLMEAMKSEFSKGSKFKNIAMTATVTGAKDQIQQLYHKKTRIFPPSLLNNDENDFFFKIEKEDDVDIIQRKIIGLKTNKKRLNYRLMHSILKYISQFIRNVELGQADYKELDSFDENDLDHILSNYKNILTYHNKKDDVHNISHGMSDFVNNDKNIYEVLSEPLTGESSSEDIKKVISKVEGLNEKDKLLAVHATSVVSHGVDIDEWNIMIFGGMPRTTAEYIQALSRVGRKFFGIVFVSYIYSRNRDLSFYQHFDEYHEILEDKVENVPLSRYGKLGLEQTFTSIFCASVLNYLSDELDTPLYTKVEFKKALKNSENVEKLKSFIKKAYISESDLKGAKYFDENLDEMVDSRVEYLIDYGGKFNYLWDVLKDNDDKYFKIQYGMRGIQDMVHLKPFLKTDENFAIKWRD